MKTVAIYCRVSPDNLEIKSPSLQTQLESCLKYCQEMGYEVAYRFSEVYSGLTLERPKLNELRELVKTSDINVIIVYCFNQLICDPVQGVMFIKEMEEHNVSVEVVTETTDSLELNKLISYIRSFVLKREVEQIREHTVDRTVIYQEEIDQILDMFNDPDILNELEIPNYIRAAMLAQKHQYPRHKICWLQARAIKQYYLYGNYTGLSKLINEYEFSPEERRRYLGEESDIIIIPQSFAYTACYYDDNSAGWVGGGSNTSGIPEWISLFHTKRNRDLLGVSDEIEVSSETEQRKLRKFFQKLFNFAGSCGQKIKSNKR